MSSEKVPLLGVFKKKDECKVPIGFLLFAFLVIVLTIAFGTIGVINSRKKEEFRFKNDIAGVKLRDETVIDYRLPDNLLPTNYYISLQPYLPSNARFKANKLNFFDGNTTILFYCKETTDRIVLNIFNITIHKYWLKELGRDEKLEENNGFVEDKRTQKIVFPLKENLENGKYYEFHVQHTGYLGDDMQGFFKTKYTDQGKERWLAATHFFHTRARRVIPMFDEPNLKAVFHLTLTYPQEMIALSNMDIKETEDLPDGWKRSEFYPTLKVSSYLFAFFVGDFTYAETKITDNAKQTKVRVYSRHDFVDQTHWALTCGPKVLNFFEKYFGVPFPLDKLDMIALPEYAPGATENWGFITYRETSLLYDQGLYPPSSKRSVSDIISHEIAHQWFGDLVTMNWWVDIFLSESFAELMAFRGAAQIGDFKWNMADYFVITDRKQAMNYDQKASSHAISFEPKNPVEFKLLFDSEITYNKGCSILKMVNKTLGSDVFMAGLHDYLSNHKYSGTNRQQLYQSLQKEVNKSSTGNTVLNVAKFIEPWIRQKGFPVIHASRQGNTIELNQERFLLGSSDSDETEEFSWDTPLWYLNRTNEKIEMSWIRGNNPLQLHDIGTAINSWYLLNPEAYGFYRVNYDYDNWLKLKDELFSNSTKIGLRAKVTILDDAFTFAKADLLPFSYSMDLSCFLKSEIEYLPWAMGFSHLDYIGTMLSSTEHHDEFSKYLLNLMQNLYTSLTIDKVIPTDDIMQHDLQASIFRRACQLNEQQCVKFALDSFDEYTKSCNNSHSSDSICNKISPNLRHTVYCTAMMTQQSKSAFEFLFNKLLIETQSEEASTILSGLSCVKEPKLLDALLNASIAGVLNSNQRIKLYRNLPDNDAATGLTWNWIKDNWEWISKCIEQGRYIEKDLNELISAATSNFNKYRHYLSIKMFTKTHQMSDSTLAAFQSSLETIKTNINWMNKHVSDISKWLHGDRCTLM